MPASKPRPDNRSPIAVSFVRYSDPAKQRRGNSTGRQTKDSEAWCKRNDLTLDRSLHHAGSGFHGKHRDDKTALGQFLHDAQTGKVPRGSFLIIENLDRLSREDERTAIRLWLDILDAGVNIVQLHPETIFRHDKSDMVDIMRAIIELSRGHSESRIKSVRSLANWDKAVELARSEGRIMTSRLPGWIELDSDSRPKLIMERAAVIRRVFAWAQHAGYGFSVILKKLIAEEVPAWGDRVLEYDEDGKPYWRAAEGERYGCGEWRVSYIRQLLSDRRVLGELQPRDRAENAKGPAIPGYYPAVVSLHEYFAARAAIFGRKRSGCNRQGRIGKGDTVANLFSGLLRDARSDSSYYVASYTEKGKLHKRLLNQSSIEQKGRAYTFPYPVFEAAILSMLRELTPADVCGGPSPNPGVVESELKKIRMRRAELAGELMRGHVSEIAQALRDLQVQEEGLRLQLDDAQERVARTPKDTWRDFRDLAEMLARAEDENDTRMRLRAVLRRTIDSIWLLIVPRGRNRLLAVQVYFAEGGRRRDYLVYFKAGLANAVMRTEGGYWPCSWDKVADLGPGDLRKPADARELEVFLSALNIESLAAAIK